MREEVDEEGGGGGGDEVQKKKIKSQIGRWTPRTVFGNYRRVLLCVEARYDNKVYMTD